MKLRRNVAQNITTDRIDVPVFVKESENSFDFLKRLNGPVEQHAIETTILKSDVILVVLVEPIHGENLLLVRHPEG